jgi:hypothetical protein
MSEQRSFKVGDEVIINPDFHWQSLEINGVPAKLNTSYIVRSLSSRNGWPCFDEPNHSYSPRFFKLAQATSYPPGTPPKVDDIYTAEIRLVEYRCGACYGKVDRNGPYGSYSYPTRWIISERGPVLKEQQHFCAPCAESIAKHIQYLKVNHGPTRTGRA